MKETILKVRGMVCNGCEERIKKALKDMSGVEEVKADHNKGEVKVIAKEYVARRDLEEKIEDIGFDVEKEN